MKRKCFDMVACCIATLACFSAFAGVAIADPVTQFYPAGADADVVPALPLSSDIEGAPRAPGTTGCGEAVFSNLNATFAATIAGGFPGTGAATSLGNGITLGTPGSNRSICAVTVTLQENNPAFPGIGTAFNVTCSIYSACPTAGGANTPCNAALLLGEATTNGVVIPQGFAGDVSILFSPPLTVPNNIFVTFRTSRMGPQIQGGAVPTNGTQQSAFATRCGSTANNNSCSVALAGSNCFAFEIEALPTAGNGSCCNIGTGLGCVENVAAEDCTGENELFTIGGDCDDCEQHIGACCFADHCDDNASIPDCSAADGQFLGNGSVCVTACLAPFCQLGDDGQPSQNSGVAPSIETSWRADNFTPKTSTPITSVTWWGAYHQLSPGLVPCTPTSPDEFQIKFFNDGGGSPLQEIASFNIGDSATVVDTGVDLNFAGGPVSVFQYSVTGLSVPVNANECYWISIVNFLDTNECIGDWIFDGERGDAFSAWQGPNFIDEPGIDLSWCFDVDVFHDGCDSAVEVPGGCCSQLGAVCNQKTVSDCLDEPGNPHFFGPNTVCTSCVGACCSGVDGTVCQMLTQAQCQALSPSGTFRPLADGETCDDSPCQGACCLADGSGCFQQEKDACLASFGSYHGGELCPNDDPEADFICGTNDPCNPTVLTCPQTIVVNNAGQANFELEPNQDDSAILSCYGGATPDDNTNGVGSFWVSFVGDGSPKEINTCGSNGLDTVLAVYASADPCAGGGPLASEEVVGGCDEDACGDAADLSSRVCIPTVNGTTYHVQITSFDEASVGDITVNLLCDCAAACDCPGDVN
ncbi:MAG TPA: hypothetical protein VNT79_12805, partial [Phycisphaerae bacterium]|nr:hypothetical protein [Phycisphaerae bacterium]